MKRIAIVVEVVQKEGTREEKREKKKDRRNEILLTLVFCFFGISWDLFQVAPV